MADKNITAAAYIRVSTDDQAEYSPTSQRKLIKEYAQRNGMTLPDEYIYIDEGISGTSTNKRIAFQQMIATAKTKPKPFDVILLWKFSRFARSRQDSIVYKSMLRKQLGIDVISITETLGDDNMSILIEALIEAMDEYYSINLAQEVRRGMTEKFSRGEALTYPSFGYEIIDGQYIPHKDNAAVVQKIYNDYVNDVPIQQIVKYLNDNDIKTMRGNKFMHRSVVYILRNPIYIGKIRWAVDGRDKTDYYKEDSALIDGVHTPIITKEVWDIAQAKLEANRRLYPVKGKTYNKNEYMLRGIVRCSDCGSTLLMAGANKYLQCGLYTKGVCGVSHHVPVKKLNEAVIKGIEDSFTTLNFTISENSEPPAPDNTELTRLTSKLGRVKAAYENGIDTLAEYKVNKARILEQIEHCKQNKKVKAKKITPKEFADKNISLLNELKSDKLSEAEKNKILRSFVRKIIYNKKEDKIQIYFYS